MVREQDGRFAWLICFATCLVLFVTLGQVYAFAVFYPEILNEFNRSAGLTGLMFGVATFVINGGGIFSGMLIQKVGYARLGCLGGTLVGLGSLLCSFSQDIWMLTGCYGVILGVGSYMNMAAALPMVNMWFIKRRSLAAGISMSGSGAGMMILAPTSQAIIDAYGWRTGFRLFAVLGLVTAAVAYLSLIHI
eukprot:TRINITY_DN44272_c0_g1_i2.p1 TRINITY_DN44272_c0_g1~~TRINITY_DN44272_c0_g1_i2.p1  ORF type:complete len:191 (-),score=40.15 TRINITY_DN44272_c0_g1_i2:101-673(-)